jgi:hypothetical protein
VCLSSKNIQGAKVGPQCAWHLWRGRGAIGGLRVPSRVPQVLGVAMLAGMELPESVEPGACMYSYFFHKSRDQSKKI